MACRQFPRLALLAPDSVSLTLSHFCPTAAGLLFADTPRTIVEDPPALPRGGGYEGLDAREAVPPLLRPGVLMGWDGYRLWEEHAVAALTDDALAPEDALALLEAQAEIVRAWRVEEGPFRTAFADSLRLWQLARACFPPELTAPADLPPGVAEADRRWVAPDWPSWAGPVRRYLAAKAFASWCALQGEGLRTIVSAVRTAWAVLRVEAARRCESAGRPLDAILMKEAIRAAEA